MKTTSLSKIISGAGVAAALLGAGVPCRADYAAEVLAQQPITYWRFNETVTPPSDLTAVNAGSLGASGNGAYLSLQAHPAGAIVASTDPAAAFNGIEDRIDVPYNAAFNPSGAFTVEFWAMITNNPGLMAPLQSRGSGAANGYLFFANNGDNKWWFRTYTGTTRANVISTNTIVLNQWTHVVGVRDANGANHLYINGAEANAPTVGGYTPQTTSPLRIGAGANESFSGSWYWPGYLDEVAFYPTGLSAAQVAAHYANGIASSPSQSYNSLVLTDGATGYWRLNEPQPSATVVKNLGSFGTVGDGHYRNFTVTEQSTLVPTTYPALDSTNRDLRFDGTNTPVIFGLTNVPVPWTAVFWLDRQDAVGASAVLLNSSVSGIKSEQWGTTRLFGFTAYGVADYNFAYSAPVDTWVHLALVATPGNTALYVNGAFQENYSASTSLPLLRLGNMVDAPKGAIDELATFNRPLLEGQIKTLYLTATGSTAPPGFVNSTPVVTPSGTIYATTPFSLSIDVYGSGPLTYQWRKDGTLVGTNRDYAKTGASLADNGNYDVIVTSPYGSVTSSIVNITINPAVPPTIDQQPASRFVYAGGSASFAVAASGTPPIIYQWKHAGTNLPGATNLTLVVTNCGAAQSGAYTVGVTNVAGGIITPAATLTLRTPAAGTYESGVVASGPVAYWRFGETTGTTAFDYAGAHDGAIFSTVTLGAPGPASPAFAGLEANNTAFTFNATDSGVQARSLGLAGPISVAAWINPAVLTGDKAIVGENASWFLKTLGSELRLTTPGIRDHNSSGAGLKLNEWQHVAVTFQPGAAGGAKFYVNGRFISSADASSLTPGTSYVWIGTNQWTGQVFSGGIDEVALYNTILTADAIATMYSQGLYGTTTPPLVLQPPASETVALGLPATFKVVAGGSPPLAYQWNKGGTPVPGATGSVLNFAAVTFADAAQYSVTVTNKLGTANSASATLTVLPQPSFALLTNDLVVHLTFDTDFKDSSGRMNDAYPMGNPVLVAGKLGQAARLRTDTVTSTFQYLYFISAADLLFSASDSFSISLWLKYTTPFNDLPIIGNAHKSTYNNGWVLTEEGGQFEWVADDGTVTVAADPVGGPMINNGVWHQLAVVFDRTNAVANSFVDGLLVDTRSIATLGSVDSGLQLQPIIGQDDSGTYPTVFGSSMTATFDLDDLGIWRRVLSPYEVLSLYNAAQGAGQSFDKYGPIKLNIGVARANTVIGWQAGTLESNTDLKNANGWTAVNGATAPLYTAPTGTGTIFYRVRQ